MNHSLPEFSRFTATLFSVWAWAWLAPAAEPKLSLMTPQGGKAGQETTFTFSGERLADIDGIVFYDEGFSVTGFEKKEDKTAVAKISIDAKVALGQHFLRLRTRTGQTFIHPIFAGAYPNVEEAEPNSDFDAPQRVELRQTVEGNMKNEDVDYYVVTAKKGQRLSMEIEGTRTGYNNMFDPFIAILNKARFELATADDSPLTLQDAFVSIIAPEDGDYILLVRDSAYGGADNARYRLHVGDFRRPLVAYPAGGKAGSELNVKLIEQDGQSFEQKVALPADKADSIHEFTAQADGQAAPSPNFLRIAEMDNVLEAEPNDSVATATPASAVPVALNGIIEKPGDEDLFKITLKKDQTIDVRCHARSIGSSLDPVVSVLNAKGSGLAGNDDAESGSLDSLISAKAPEDGDYFIHVRDHLKKGSPTAVYRIEVNFPAPRARFASPQFVLNDAHSRQFVNVARGNRYLTLINLSRKNTGAEMKLEMSGLPPGVKMIADPIPGSAGAALVLFEAAADAPLGGAAAPFFARGKEGEKDIMARYTQPMDMLWGPPGYTVIYSRSVNQLPVVVTEEVPYHLELVAPALPLVQSGNLPLKVMAKRKEGFTKAIRVLLLSKPGDVSALNEIAIAEGQNEGVFQLDANPDAKIGPFKAAVLGEANPGDGTVYAASDFVEVKVAPRFVDGKIDLVVTEQGQEAEAVCKLTHLTPFEGKATVTLHGLPTEVTTTPVEITKESQEVVFKLKTTDKSPVGKHASLFCQIAIPSGVGLLDQKTAAASTLRIDAPRPKAVAKVEPKPEEAKPVAVAEAPKAAEPPKRLSRLEQLRLEAGQK